MHYLKALEQCQGYYIPSPGSTWIGGSNARWRTNFPRNQYSLRRSSVSWPALSRFCPVRRNSWSMFLKRKRKEQLNAYVHGSRPDQICLVSPGPVPVARPHPPSLGSLTRKPKWMAWAPMTGSPPRSSSRRRHSKSIATACCAACFLVAISFA